MSKQKKLWGGRFKQETLPLVEEYTQSVEFDKELYLEDIKGSMAHAKMLGKVGLLSEEEVQAILNGLEQIKAEIESGQFAWSKKLEDVHMNIEQRLTEIIGDAGKKLHTGRSRNDQVALDFRLFVDKCLSQWQQALTSLIATLNTMAKEQQETLLPGYTHLQPAQPVSLAQHLLAYAHMFKRDYERIVDVKQRVRVSPLGAAALAGSTYSLNPFLVAQEVGFEQVFANSMDAVSDRDFVAESLFVATLIQMHLSRLCEEIILWANPCFGFLKLPDEYATGSSIMPQKKNPDVAEIMRGKTGRVYGNLIALLTILKGLPLTYNRDLQEDKEPFLDTHKTIYNSLILMKGMLAKIEFNAQNMLLALKKGYLNATELADYLVLKGIPFRDAHHITGKLVGIAEEKGVGLEDLELKEMQAVCPQIESDVFQVLDYRQAVKRRNTPGGTGPLSVSKQIEEIDKWLKENGGSV
ncbi:MAG TPA: argininosuccinate lyase [Desulfonauticus sp.]|nr:MAG: Argininosuccinate lyase [Desulfonauticus sp. 38_4375]HCO11770.1 argininosuccinate lyase [Desulfonauticus sp.]